MSNCRFVERIFSPSIKHKHVLPHPQQQHHANITSRSRRTVSSSRHHQLAVLAVLVFLCSSGIFCGFCCCCWAFSTTVLIQPTARPHTGLHRFVSPLLHAAPDDSNANSDAHFLSFEKHSLAQLLQQLDEKGIRYPPTAKRKELERLLLLEHQHHAGNDDNDKNEKPHPESNQLPPLVNVSFSLNTPSTIKSSLQSNGTMTTKSQHPSSSNDDNEKTNNQFTKSSIRDILQQLDDMDIRYPPTATRQDLEQILQGAIQTENEKRLHQTKSSAENYSKRQDEKQTAIMIKYQRKRLRRQRQRLSSSSKQRHQAAVAVAVSPWKRLVRKGHGAVSRRVMQSSDRAKRRARTITRKVSEMLTVDQDGVRNVDFTYLHKEEPQVTTANVTPSDDPIDVQVIKVTRDHSHRQGTFVAETAKENELSGAKWSASINNNVELDHLSDPTIIDQRASGGIAESTDPTVWSSAETNVPLRRNRSKSSKATSSVPPYRLPAADDEYRQSYSSTKTTARGAADRQRSRKHGVKRRIYSPYKSRPFVTPGFFSNGLDDDKEKDAIDRFGDFLADAADRVMWGAYDVDDGGGVNGDISGSTASKQKNNSAKKVPRTRKYRNSSTSKNGMPFNATTAERIHWKDRLEQRLDYMLGIHEDGEYYNKWANREAYQRRNQGGFDPLSVAQGRQPRRSVTHRKRNRKYSKPVWEEEGNLISLLFGRTPSGDSLLFERLLDPTNGSLVNLFRSIFKTALLGGSYLCRWASVGGALPQPIVVLGLTTAALCARKRVRALVIALVVLRTMGELVHGYVYGDDGWEDGDDEEDYFDQDENISVNGY